MRCNQFPLLGGGGVGEGVSPLPVPLLKPNPCPSQEGIYGNTL